MTLLPMSAEICCTDLLSIMWCINAHIPPVPPLDEEGQLPVSKQRLHLKRHAMWGQGRQVPGWDLSGLHVPNLGPPSVECLIRYWSTSWVFGQCSVKFSSHGGSRCSSMAQVPCKHFDTKSFQCIILVLTPLEACCPAHCQRCRLAALNSPSQQLLHTSLSPGIRCRSIRAQPSSEILCETPSTLIILL